MQGHSQPKRVVHGRRADLHGGGNPAVEQMAREVRSFLEQVLADLRTSAAADPYAGSHSDICPARVADAAFMILTHREFSYLGKAKAGAYRPAIADVLTRNIERGEPLRFHLDLGGGYHASIDPTRYDLSFQPGLGEVLVLRQVKRLHEEVRKIYEPGIRLTLVIDNLCALLVNDIPVSRTSGYCRSLRSLIGAFGMADMTDVLVESEEFDASDYANASIPTVPAPSPSAIDNVARFLGRPCSGDEARERIGRYASLGQESDRKLGSIIDGVRMTQRATPSTFGFRAFPGGDCRIQAGEVVLTRNPRGRLVPKLATSKTLSSYTLYRIDTSRILPWPVTSVAYSLWVSHPIGTSG
jgi:hypothetical protein